MAMTEQQKKYWNEYQREYRKRKPEQIMKQRITAAINLLNRNGYKVNRPERKEGAAE